jgi:hypothetical protein
LAFYGQGVLTLKKLYLCAAAAVVGSAVMFAGAANAATYSYVGSWQVDDGPIWWPVPETYTGQEAAALLFGGNASDYVISTISNLVADIDHLTWVSTWGGVCGGVNCGTKVAQDYEKSTLGFYATAGDTSAYVSDWAEGSEFTNYAFRVSPVPLPAALPLLASGLAGLWLVSRRRQGGGAAA